MEKQNFIFLSISRNRIRKFFINEIIYFKAENLYTRIKLTDDSTCLVCKPLKKFEELFKNPDFYRINRSYIINLNLLLELEKGSKPKIKLVNNEILRPDKNKVEAIERSLIVLQNKT